MDEVHVEAVHFGDEVRIAVDPRFDFPPVMVVEPMIGELLDRREPDALRVIVDRLAFGPSRRCDPPLEIDEIFLRKGRIAGAPAGAPRMIVSFVRLSGDGEGCVGACVCAPPDGDVVSAMIILLVGEVAETRYSAAELLPTCGPTAALLPRRRVGQQR
jgi:hypothetical protein